MEATTKKRLGFLAGFALYFGAIWFLWDTAIVYPLKVFVVLLHEISHGVVATATGGTIERITLDRFQGGACYCPGGNAFLTLSAGYLGSLIWGAVILAAAQSRRIPARGAMGVVGVLVVLFSGLFVRSAFGLAFGIGFGAALLVVSRKLPIAFNRIGLVALGLTSCLYAILDIKSDVLDRPELRSDAAMLAELTGIPTLVWGVVWISVAIVFSVLYFRRAYRKGSV